MTHYSRPVPPTIEVKTKQTDKQIVKQFNKLLVASLPISMFLGKTKNGEMDRMDSFSR